MIKEKEGFNAFLLHFLERLNGCESIEKKVTESLTDICNYYGFKRGFVYQTDGFRYFYLKETIGNENNILRPRFEINEMTKQHIAHTKNRNTPFYSNRNKDTSHDDKTQKEKSSDLLDLLTEIRQTRSQMRSCK